MILLGMTMETGIGIGAILFICAAVGQWAAWSEDRQFERKLDRLVEHARGGEEGHNDAQEKKHD